MSRTVSFRCSEELDDFLEQEAERRMTTKSAVAQMIVAEYAQDQDSDTDENDGSTDHEASVSDENELEPVGRLWETEPERVLEKYSDCWYKPGGKKNYAVRHPNPEELDYRPTKYYKGKEYAAKRLLEWYEND